MKTLTLLLLTLLLLINGSASKSIINTLPGFAGDLPFVLETGYVEVGSKEEGQLFYVFIESERNPENDPLVLWLTGGPGCSGLSGLFYEIGPLAFNYAKCRSANKPVLELNPNSWTKVASIIFLDAPIGSGFSYSTTAEGYVVSDTITAAQNCEFLRKWLMDHPKFLDNPLYVGGDSYSGKVVPVVVQIISDGNGAGNKPTVNLMGYVIGNPLTDVKIDINSRVPFAHGNALISDEIYQSFKKNCKGEYLNPNKNNVPCMKAIDNINECVGRIRMDHILEPNCKTLSPEPAAEDLDFTIFSDDYANLLLPSSHANEPWCRDHHYTYSNIWANDISVREALHVRKNTKEQWLRCNRSVSNTQDVGSAVDYHRNFSKMTAYRALVYSGDKDMVTPYVGTMAWIKSLNLTIKSDWHPWFVDGQVAGYCMEYTNNNFALVYATVKGAGHTATEYKPKECLAMIDRWLAQQPLLKRKGTCMKSIKTSVAGNRTRIAWVKAKYPNRWTTTEYKLNKE